jgi:hypothetical protein
VEADNLVEPLELGLTSNLMVELRGVINDPRYDHLKVSELSGCLDLLKLEYSLKWLRGD